MNIKFKVSILALTMSLTASSLAMASASPHKTLEPTNTFRTNLRQAENHIEPRDLKEISDLDISFSFSGAECVIKSSLGCRVTKSSNPALPIGLIIKADIARVSGPSASFTSLKRGCGWCSVAGDFFAIALYIYYAPVTAPSALVVATYSVGVGIILGHA